MSDEPERPKVSVMFEGSPIARIAFEGDLEHFAEETSIEDDEAVFAGWTERLFNLQDAIEGGQLLALIDALRICEEQQIPLPTWLNTALIGIVASAVRGDSFGQRGRGNNLLAKARAMAVICIHERLMSSIRLAQREPENGLVQFLCVTGRVREYLDKNPGTRIGRSVDDAANLVSAALRGTMAQATADTIRNNWRGRGRASEILHYGSCISDEAFGLVGMDEISVGTMDDPGPVPDDASFVVRDSE